MSADPLLQRICCRFWFLCEGILGIHHCCHHRHFCLLLLHILSACCFFSFHDCYYRKTRTKSLGTPILPVKALGRAAAVVTPALPQLHTPTLKALAKYIHTHRILAVSSHLGLVFISPSPLSRFLFFLFHYKYFSLCCVTEAVLGLDLFSWFPLYRLFYSLLSWIPILAWSRSPSEEPGRSTHLIHLFFWTQGPLGSTRRDQ